MKVVVIMRTHANRIYHIIHPPRKEKRSENINGLVKNQIECSENAQVFK